jgi:hypothetical protein
LDHFESAFRYSSSATMMSTAPQDNPTGVWVGGPENVPFVEAAHVYRNIPQAGHSGFDFIDAMIFVGIQSSVAYTAAAKLKLEVILSSLSRQHGPPHFENSADAKVQRTERLLRLSRDTHLKSKMLTSVMELAGCDKMETKGCHKLYMRCYRMRINLATEKKKNQARPVVPPTLNHLVAPPARNHLGTPSTPPVASVNPTGRGIDSISPLSLSGASSLAASVPPLVNFQRSAMIRGQPDLSVASLSNSATSSSKRKTTAVAQQDRASLRAESLLYDGIYKVSTILYNEVHTKTITLEKFKTADKCATEINNFFGVQAITGNQLKDAVRVGRAGKSPPQRGKPSEIPKEDFKELATLMFTLSAIEQANASADRLTKPALQSLLGTIVNHFMMEKWQKEMHVPAFYKRIQIFNSSMQVYSVMDPRASIRVQWLKYDIQLKNYQAWERILVERGYARMPENEMEREEKGHVVFYPGQERRIVNFDEMKLTLDGTDESAGGRPATTPSFPGIPESGKAVDKNDNKCTIMMGIAGNEPLPPLIIFTCNTKNVEKRKLNFKALTGFKQVYAQYGYEEARWHDCSFARNPKGGMNKELFEGYILNDLADKFPDATNQPGKRVMAKTDSGPGRSSTATLARMKVDGFDLFPGVPNGTEIGQEMDQLFAAFKGGCYRNRDKLWEARRRMDGEKATCTENDVGALIFGGMIRLANNTREETVELENVFAKYFHPDHIEAARKKCGYSPATRNALKSSQIRHEVIEADDGNPNEEADPLGPLLDELEKQNHAMVEALEAKNYHLARQAKRFVNRTTVAQQQGTRAVSTVENSRERQDLLLEAHTAGKFFHVTGGGGLMNSSDALMARERKVMSKAAEALEKKKKLLQDFAKKVRPAKELMRKPSNSWKAPELKLVLMYIEGPAEKKKVNLKFAEMKELYATKYESSNKRRWKKWSASQERELTRLKDGEIESERQTSIYGKALEAQNECLFTRLVTIGKSRRKDVLSPLLCELSATERQHYLDLLTGDSNLQEENDDNSLANDRATPSDDDLENSDGEDEREDYESEQDEDESENKSIPNDDEGSDEEEALSQQERAVHDLENSNGEKESEEDELEEEDEELENEEPPLNRSGTDLSAVDEENSEEGEELAPQERTTHEDYESKQDEESGNQSIPYDDYESEQDEESGNPSIPYDDEGSDEEEALSQQERAAYDLENSDREKESEDDESEEDESGTDLIPVDEEDSEEDEELAPQERTKHEDNEEPLPNRSGTNLFPVDEEDSEEEEEHENSEDESKHSGSGDIALLDAEEADISSSSDNGFESPTADDDESIKIKEVNKELTDAYLGVQKRMEEKKTLRILDLKILIKSRGIEPPTSGKKEVFITQWEEVKCMPVIASYL